ncbi:growth hormone secretagogue receptor type 1-like [Branchiostoma floridae x Branchiostoma belcheri]
MEYLNFTDGVFPNGSLGWPFELDWDAASPLLPRADILAVSAVYGLVFAVGVVGNLAVGASVCGVKELRTATNFFLLNLSVADLLVLLVCMPISLLEIWVPFPWLLGEALCKLTPFFEVLVFQASILTMVAVSADRYQGVCHPLLTQSSNRRRRALLSIALVWGISLAASSPVLHIATYTELDLNGTVVCQCNFPVDSAWKNHYTTVITVGFFVLPLVALSVMYFAIGRRLIRPPAGETSAHLQAQHRSRRRVVLMLGTVVAVFFVCLLPHRLFQLWLLYAPTKQMEWLGLLGFVKVTIFMRMMVYINCSLNPIIYTLFSTRFRTAFFKCCSSSEGSDTFTSGQQAHRNTARDRNNANRNTLQNHLLFEQVASNTSPPCPDRRHSNVTSATALTRLTSFPVTRSASNARYNEPSFKQEYGELCVYVWESHV